MEVSGGPVVTGGLEALGSHCLWVLYLFYGKCLHTASIFKILTTKLITTLSDAGT